MDRFGPVQFDLDKAMDVAPHPHIGLQTVSWLLNGEIVHKDSLGCEAVMRAGQLNLMTAGHGIAHSEETPDQNTGCLDGIQLWVALPESQRHLPPRFDHYASLTMFDISSVTVTLIAGKMLGHESPANVFSPIAGAELEFHEGQIIDLPLDPKFEYAIFPLRSEGSVDSQPLRVDALHYLAPGRDELRIAGNRDSRLLLIGGEPFPEPILMWWNFVARSHEEMAAARHDWARQHQRFGEVKNYSGPRLAAPELAASRLRT